MEPVPRSREPVVPYQLLDPLKNLKNRITGSRAYNVARGIKWYIRENLGPTAQSVLSLVPDQPSHGRVLFSYRAAFEALALQRGQRPVITHPNYWASIEHPNYWSSMQMVTTYLERGFAVDVITSDIGSFVPAENYAVVVDVRQNLERFAPLLNASCAKVMHLDTAHLLISNAAEMRRLLELRERKGATLCPRRMQLPNRGIEVADCATTTGNEWTLGTYSYANKPIYRLPIAASVNSPWPEDKDWEACRRRFLWVSSGGLVYKGLDLALEAFAAMPEYELTVCCPSPLEWEEDFARVYYKELYQTPNIRTLGWVDVNSDAFTEIAGRCATTLLFSCAEGASTSAMNCMHAGLVPVLSHECGVDLHDFGFVLRDCSIESIKSTIRRVASLSADELEERARSTWEYARANHSREKFAEKYREVVDDILSGRIRLRGSQAAFDMSPAVVR